MRSNMYAPEKKFYERKGLWIVLGLIGLLVGAFFIGQNNAAKRDLFIVNGLNVDLIVRLDGEATDIVIKPEKYRKVKSAEGSHTVEIVQPANLAATKDFSFGVGMISRVLHNPAFVLDPTEAGIVVYEETVYSENPTDNGLFELNTGELIHEFKDVDYHFAPFPSEIETERNSVRKSRVSFMPFTPAMFLSLDSDTPPERQLELTQNWLDQNPNDVERLQMYLIIGGIHGADDKCKAHIESKLDEKPLLLEIHRTYQSIAEHGGDDMQPIIARYDELLKDDPDNPDLIYLRGRIETDNEKANEYFESALAKSPKHVYSLGAIGFARMAQVDFDEALTYYEKAYAIDPENPMVKDHYEEMLYATKQYHVLTNKGFVNLQPTDTKEFISTINYYAASGRMNKVQQLATSMNRKLTSDFEKNPVKISIAYLNKNYPAIKTLSSKMQGFEHDYYNYMAAVELHEHESADALLHKLSDDAQDTANECIAIAAKLAGHDRAFNEKLDEIVKHLKSEGPTEIEAARIITAARQNGSLDIDELRSIEMDIEQKRVFVGLIKLILNKKVPEVEELLIKLNFDPSFPHNLIQSVIEREAGRPLGG